MHTSLDLDLCVGLVGWRVEVDLEAGLGCQILPSNRFGTVSARLSVAAADAETVEVLNTDFWPNLAKVGPWKFEAVAGEGDGW